MKELRKNLKKLSRLNIIGFQITLGRTPRAISQGDDYSFNISVNTEENMNWLYNEGQGAALEIFKILFPDVDYRWFESNSLTVSEEKMNELISKWSGDNLEYENIKDVDCGAGDWEWFRYNGNIEEGILKVKELTKNLIKQ